MSGNVCGRKYGFVATMGNNKTFVDLPEAPVSAEAPSEEGLMLGAETQKLPLVIVEPGAASPSAARFIG